MRSKYVRRSQRSPREHFQSGDPFAIVVDTDLKCSFVPPTVDPRVAQWAAQVIEDGRLAAALQEIANNDQDLAD